MPAIRKRFNPPGHARPRCTAGAAEGGTPERFYS